MTLARALGAKVSVLTVSLPFDNLALDPALVTSTAAEYEEECEARAEKTLGFARTEAAAAGVPCETLHLIRDHPYQAILDTARTKGCDLICMASHGRTGVAGLVLGSETNKVLTHGRVPVLVCR
jgi:nucleotide-binding universal stress UspA family protein